MNRSEVSDWLRVLSLGWGTQSYTLAAMAALGEIPPLDYAVFSDTTHERAATYEFAREQTPWLTERGVRVVTVRPESAEPVDRFGGVMIPAFSATSDKAGQIKRQCTRYWKVAPIRRWLQEHREGRRVALLLGISVDEIMRAKDSGVGYIDHVHPLLDLGLTRTGCLLWLERHNLPVPSRSACYCCPYQSNRDWQQIRGEDYEHAVAVDEAIREQRPPNLLYVHKSLRPLEEVDLRSEEQRGQLDLWGSECEAGCGL